MRREEVAQLAGVSVDYYVRLEQGRTPNVSDAVLDAVARALELDDTERAHLDLLARPLRPARTARPGTPPQRVRPQVRQLVEAMTDVAAYIVGRRTDVLAWNRLGAALIADFDRLPRRQRNFAWLMFGEASVGAQLFADWPVKARDIVAFLHADAGRHPDDPALAELVGELSVQSPLFRRLWADHPVRDKGHAVAVLRHSLIGAVELAYEALQLPADPDQILVTYSAPVDSATVGKLRLLASWHADPPAVGSIGERSAVPPRGAGSGGPRPI